MSHGISRGLSLEEKFVYGDFTLDDHLIYEVAVALLKRGEIAVICVNLKPRT